MPSALYSRTSWFFGAALLAALSTVASSARAQVTAPRDTLHLAALQHAARAHDPRGAQAALLTEQSELRLRNLRSERFPTFGLTGQSQYQSDVTNIPIPGALSPAKDTYDANVALRLRLFDPSRAPRRGIEQASLAESQARLASALYGQRSAVNDAFFSALLLDGQHAVLAAGIADLEAQRATAEVRVREGAALPGDEAMLHAELLRRRQLLAELAANRSVALAMLADLTGMTVPATATLALPANDDAVATARASVDAARMRPEYAQFAQSRAVLAERGAAVTAQEQPRVSAFGRTGYGRPALNPLSSDFDTYWLAGVQVEWAPWNWGSARREREALALQTKIVTTEEASFTDRIRRGTLADFAAIDRLTASVADDSTIVALREQVLRETRVRFTEGVITAAELVDRETDVLTAQLARAAHTVELAQARARLLTTLGLEVR